VKEGQWDARDAIFARTDTDIDSPLYLIPMAGERLLWGWPSISKKALGFRNHRKQPSRSRRHILNILEPSETGRTGRRPTPSPRSRDRRRQVQCQPRDNGGPCLPRPFGGLTHSPSWRRWMSFSRLHGTLGTSTGTFGRPRVKLCSRERLGTAPCETRESWGALGSAGRLYEWHHFPRRFLLSDSSACFTLLGTVHSNHGDFHRVSTSSK
jgi:hypothetical protein